MRWARLLRLAAITSAVALVLTLTGAAVADRFLTSEVQFIVPKPKEVVAFDREEWEPGQPVAEIYGTPVGGAVRVVLPDTSKLVHPTEDTTLVLMQVDKQRGENPLQIKTVWFVAVRVALGLGLVGLIALLGNVLLRRVHRRRKRAVASS